MKKIEDGIICEDEYKDSNLKILWILKEGNVAEADEDIKRDICEEIRNEYHLKNALSIPTFRKMIYATYGILHSDVEWNNVPYANELNAYNVLKKVAYININKMPGKGTAIYSVIKDAYEENEELLISQIKEFNPNIIIFGNTLHFFNNEKLQSIGWNYLNTTKMCYDYNNESKSTAFYLMSNDRLIINAYHPAYPRISNYQYWLEIKTAVHIWIEKMKSKS